MAPFEYSGPVGDGPNGWSVEVVEPDPINQMRYMFDGRPSGDGPFVVLRHNRVLWMSDTDAELRDHSEPVFRVKEAASNESQAKALIHGLGLGLVTAAALRSGANVDVVEIDRDLCDWMELWLQDVAAEHGRLLTVHVADVFEKRWPARSRWDVVWHDIWPDITPDNLPEMTRLHRSYGRRSDWQGSWARYTCERYR
jgi:hypothetical protein